MELTLEQEFSLMRFSEQVQQISREQAQELLVEQQKLMMLRNTLFQKLLKHEWKLDLDAVSS
jgi:Phycobilisome degradation protein nblA